MPPRRRKDVKTTTDILHFVIITCIIVCKNMNLICMAIHMLTEQVDKYRSTRTLNAHPLNIAATLSMNDSLNSR